VAAHISSLLLKCRSSLVGHTYENPFLFPAPIAMDVYTIGHFPRSVNPMLMDVNTIPAGGLRHFLEHDLREKVFLVSLPCLTTAGPPILALL
jgi:hypothetical protein